MTKTLQKPTITARSISEKDKYHVIILLALIVFLSGFLFSSPQEIIQGIVQLVQSPSILVSDYFAIANIGAALVNAGILMLIAITIAHLAKASMNGPVIAAVLTIGGFALFGKNIYNIWPIFIGVWLFATYQKESFGKFILPALFGTALGPLVSQVTFGFGFAQPLGYILGIIFGIMAGFVLPPLANHFVRFHQGFNLYNIGFTAGIIGMIFMSFFRAYGLQNPPTLFAYQGGNVILTISLMAFFTLILIIGIIKSTNLWYHLKNITSQSGRLVSDFVTTDGFGASLVNMALVGYLSTIYVLLVGGQLNGATIGGIFTIVGFGAFGKHPKNIIPIFVGVYLGATLKIFEVNATGAVLAALFGTTLAPIAGAYGWFYGIIAGFFHIAVVMNVGYLHGGINLYNNGFAGGFVAAVLVPIINSIQKNKME